MEFSKNTILIIVAIVASFFVHSIFAAEFMVGDDQGWSFKFDSKAWTQGKEFYVGDKIVFRYTPGAHNVLRVNQTGFQDCKAPEGIVPLNTGNDVITLSSPGMKWYICGFHGHCDSGNMKLSLTVLPGVGSPSGSPTNTAPAPTSKAANIVGIADLYYHVFFVAITAIFGMVSFKLFA